MNAGQNMQVHPTDFAEPPHNFIKSMLSKEIVEKNLADEFFDGNVSMVERKWEGLTDHQLEKFFMERFGAGPMRAEREYSFVVYGASGYTGSLLIEYILKTVQNLGTKYTFALAGRSVDKLKNRFAEVKAKFPTDYEPGYIQCDLSDPMAVRSMVIQCRTVVNIAGPFMLTPADLLVRNFSIYFLCLSLSFQFLSVSRTYHSSSSLHQVEACIEYDADYIDVNGEIPFSAKLIEYHDWARNNDVLVVPNCAGAGGVPDVGAFYTFRKLQERIAKSRSDEIAKSAAVSDDKENATTNIVQSTEPIDPLKIDCSIDTMHMYLCSSGGGVPSGGTLATRAAMNSAMRDVHSLMMDPYALGGAIKRGQRPEDADKHLSVVEYDEEYKGWKAPFTYAFYETRLIRRSNWLSRNMGGVPYGRNLNYLEHLILPSEEHARALQQSNTSSKMEEEKLKAEGKLFAKDQGLSLEDRDKIWAEYWFDAVTEHGEKIRTRLTGKDGYDETAHLSVELALLTSEHRDELPHKGGVLTPGVAGGQLFVEALNETGLTFEVVDDDALPDLSRIPPIH